jgi:SPX domain protein involved in polyphosphate accumulation
MNVEHNKFIPVEGHSNLFRDKETNAIINTDSAGYAQYMKMKQQKQNEKNELDKIKSDIEEIKSLLRELANGSK